MVHPLADDSRPYMLFAGGEDAAFERHLTFDQVADSELATDRQRFEALARAVRDLLARRWLKTKETHEHANPKRIYYLSMEFLIGRSLTNNVTNLLMEPTVRA